MLRQEWSVAAAASGGRYQTQRLPFLLIVSLVALPPPVLQP
jgi:hypothetical protein